MRGRRATPARLGGRAMTDDVKREDTDVLWADDELSDEALDRAAEEGAKACCWNPLCQ